MKKIILLIMAMGLVMSGVVSGEEEIELTPVPEEIVKRVILDWCGGSEYIGKVSGFPDAEMEIEMNPKFEKWGDYAYCDLYPVYDEKDRVIEYLALVFRERGDYETMLEMLDRIKPLVEEWRYYDNERVRLQKLYNELPSKKKEDLITGEEFARLRKEYNDELRVVSEKKREVFDEICNYGQYGHCYSRANYEQGAGFSAFSNGRIPWLLMFYWEMVDKIKDEYDTDDVEFVCFRRFDEPRDRGIEFKAGDIRIYATFKHGRTAQEPDKSVILTEITPDMRSIYFDKHKPTEEKRKSWEKYEDEFYEDEG